MLLLVGVEDFSYEQAAHILELSIDTVMASAFRCGGPGWLAENLNSMLDRIEELVGTNRQVSDNIAHDLARR